MYGNIPYMEHLCYISPTKVSLIFCDPWSKGDFCVFLCFFAKNDAVDLHVSWQWWHFGPARGSGMRLCDVSMFWVDFAAGFHTLIGKKCTWKFKVCRRKSIHPTHLLKLPHLYRCFWCWKEISHAALKHKETKKDVLGNMSRLAELQPTTEVGTNQVHNEVPC